MNEEDIKFYAQYPTFESYLEDEVLDIDLDRELFKADSSGEKTNLPVLWKEVNQKIHTEQPWRINGLIPKQGFVILASISGERKTWLALEMAKAISSSADFLDEKDFKTEGCNVLYLNCENPENEMQRRGRQLGFTEESAHKLYMFNGDDIDLNKAEGAKWLLAAIEYYRIGVVFIDTLRAVSGGLKEDKAEEVRQFFRKFTGLKNKGVTLVWLDHFRKPSNLDGKVPKKEHLLGSQDKTASIEVLLMLKSESGSEEINFYQRKNRLAIERPPFKILMQDHYEESGDRKTKLSYAGPIEEQESKKEEAKDIILSVLENGGRGTNEILELINKQVGAKNIRAALRELVKEKLIEVGKRAKQNYYFLPKEETAPETLPTDEFESFFDDNQ